MTLPSASILYSKESSWRESSEEFKLEEGEDSGEREEEGIGDAARTAAAGEDMDIAGRDKEQRAEERRTDRRNESHDRACCK